MDSLRDEDLSSVVDKLPFGVYRVTATGRILGANDSLVRLLGAASFDELASVSVFDFFPDAPSDDWLMRLGTTPPGPSGTEHHIRCLDGTWRWVRIIASDVEESSDGDIRLSGVVQDVTEQHVSSERAELSNTLLDTLTLMQYRYMAGVELGVLFDGLLDGLLRSTGSAYGFIAQLLHDDDGPFLRTWAMTDISWNEATRALYELHGPRGMEFHNLDTLFGRVVTEDAPLISHEPLKDPRAAGRPDGHPPLDSFFGLPVHKGGEVTGMVALANRPGGYDEGLVQVLTPLTATVASLIEAAVLEKESAEVRRRHALQEELDKSIIARAADAIVTFRSGGRILFANRSAAQIVGSEDSDLVGERLHRFIPRSMFSETFRQSETALATGSSVELVVRRVSGDERPIEATFVQGQYHLADVTTMIARDIGARKELERTLLSARDAAESTARAKDELLAGMSHELRTPLNAVIGLSAVMQRELYGPLTAKQREHVAQIETSGRHLLDVITTILDLAKAEAHKIEPAFRNLPVRGLVEEAVGLVGELALGKGLRLTYDVPLDLPPVCVDAIRARQVLVNLLSNAVKFTEEGGRVSVGARLAEDMVSISVSDTGIGIPPEYLDTVFDPFEQVDSSLARHYEGTGLGLTLSRRLVEIQGGTLGVTSTPGRGSVFTATFRVAEPGV